jgi:methylated-DNA-[protein]-cysteine S-methyltransferase
MNEARNPTIFEMAVYAAVREIPRGKVISYGQIARQIAQGTARSVGTALAKNPFAPEVPCHRVVRADGSLGGFFGETSGPRMVSKREMLNDEGVPFNAANKVCPAAFFSPPLPLTLHEFEAPPNECRGGGDK